MKILVVTPWWPTRRRPWFGTFVKNQCAALVENGAEVDVILTVPFYGRVGHPEAWEHGELTLVRVPILPRYIGADWFWRVAGWWLRGRMESGYDFALVHTEVVGAMLGSRSPLPYCIAVHGTNTDLRPVGTKRRRAFLLKGLKHARHVIAVGWPLVAWIQDHYGFTGSVAVVENGYDPVTSQIQPAPLFSGDVTTLSCVGALDEDKGQRILIAAAAELAANGERIVIHFVGDGSDREALQKNASGLNGLDVKFHGWCSPEQAADIVAQSDLFVLPSRREAIGIVYLNAMALGRPVIGVRGQGIDGIIKDLETGFLMRPDDPEHLSTILRWIMTHKDETRRIAMNGRELVLEHFSWSRNAERLISLFRNNGDQHGSSFPGG